MIFVGGTHDGESHPSLHIQPFLRVPKNQPDRLLWPGMLLFARQVDIEIYEPRVLGPLTVYAHESLSLVQVGEMLAARYHEAAWPVAAPQSMTVAASHGQIIPCDDVIDRTPRHGFPLSPGRYFNRQRESVIVSHIGPANLVLDSHQWQDDIGRTFTEWGQWSTLEQASNVDLVERADD